MIVFASMLLFHDPVSALQFFGFAVALGGLVHYQLGGAPAFQGYYKTFRMQQSGQKSELQAAHTPTDLEAQTPTEEAVEPFQDIKQEVKHA